MDIKMKKVLKLTAGLITDVTSGSEGKRCVKLTFQYHRENMPSDGKELIIYRREEPDFVFDCDEEE